MEEEASRWPWPCVRPGQPRSTRYNRGVTPADPRPLANDTAMDAERRQISCWQAMTPAQKVELSSSLCRTTHALAAAGVRLRHPGAPAREQFLRLAIVRLGRDLAVCAFPEARGLEP